MVGGGGVDPNVRCTRRLTLTADGPQVPPTSPPNHSPPLPSGMMANTPMGYPPGIGATTVSLASDAASNAAKYTAAEFTFGPM